MPKCDAKTRYIPATFAWTLLIGATTLFFYYPAQYYLPKHPWVPAYQGLITFFVLANFTLATFMDPGIIPKAPPDEDRDDDFRAPLYKNTEINGITVRMKWCVTCKFYRPPRCSHCSVCDHCIETFDHHCPWVNNCIGRRNYRFFFFFLISLSLHMISIFTLSLIYVLQYEKGLTKTEPIIAMVLMGIVAVLAIPIFGLTGFHMVLVSRGRTTNEQVTGKFKGGYNPFSKGCWHNCCYAQFGPQFPSLIKPYKYKVKRKHCSHGPIATITNDSQVKTYMDNSNGVRSINSNAYNKMSPGRDGLDLDMEPSASQSQDCEPTPPLQRHGSKSNFFLPPNASVMTQQQQQQQHQIIGGQTMIDNSESPVRHPAIRQLHYPTRSSPHPRPRVIMDSHGGHQAADTSIGPQKASPTMQQRIKAMGVPTPLALSSPVRRSNPSTPTQPRRPDFIGVLYAPHPQGNPCYEFMPTEGVTAAAASSSSAVTTTTAISKRSGQSHVQYGSSPQRRFMSESELIRQDQQMIYPRSNNTVDNIRELANSPQRGVYMWKDTSPNYPPVSTQPSDFYCSNPTSPMQQTQQQQQQTYVPQSTRNYHPAIRGGVAVYPPPPPSPQIHRKLPPTGAAPVGDARRRPMSFVRALEMSDNVDLSSQTSQCSSHPMTQRPSTPDRGSIYDMNYEISV